MPTDPLFVYFLVFYLAHFCSVTRGGCKLPGSRIMLDTDNVSPLRKGVILISLKGYMGEINGMCTTHVYKKTRLRVSLDTGGGAPVG